ncbi:unnamed protein product [Amoebophrya sp. A120]|nr:unnamed protein product [Amoebophrya sp. A120]|eukprot:GSA120T00025718001.1
MLSLFLPEEKPKSFFEQFLDNFDYFFAKEEPELSVSSIFSSFFSGKETVRLYYQPVEDARQRLDITFAFYLALISAAVIFLALNKMSAPDLKKFIRDGKKLLVHKKRRQSATAGEGSLLLENEIFASEEHDLETPLGLEERAPFGKRRRTVACKLDFVDINGALAGGNAKPAGLGDKQYGTTGSSLLLDKDNRGFSEVSTRAGSSSVFTGTSIRSTMPLDGTEFLEDEDLLFNVSGEQVFVKRRKSVLQEAILENDQLLLQLCKFLTVKDIGRLTIADRSSCKTGAGSTGGFYLHDGGGEQQTSSTQHLPMQLQMQRIFNNDDIFSKYLWTELLKRDCGDHDYLYYLPRKHVVAEISPKTPEEESDSDDSDSNSRNDGASSGGRRNSNNRVVYGDDSDDDSDNMMVDDDDDDDDQDGSLNRFRQQVQRLLLIRGGGGNFVLQRAPAGGGTSAAHYAPVAGMAAAGQVGGAPAAGPNAPNASTTSADNDNHLAQQEAPAPTGSTGGSSSTVVNRQARPPASDESNGNNDDQNINESTTSTVVNIRPPGNNTFRSGLFNTPASNWVRMLEQTLEQQMPSINASAPLPSTASLAAREDIADEGTRTGATDALNMRPEQPSEEVGEEEAAPMRGPEAAVVRGPTNSNPSQLQESSSNHDHDTASGDAALSQYLAAAQYLAASHDMEQGATTSTSAGLFSGATTGGSSGARAALQPQQRGQPAASSSSSSSSNAGMPLSTAQPTLLPRERSNLTIGNNSASDDSLAAAAAAQEPEEIIDQILVDLQTTAGTGDVGTTTLDDLDIEDCVKSNSNAAKRRKLDFVEPPVVVEGPSASKPVENKPITLSPPQIHEIYRHNKSIINGNKMEFFKIEKNQNFHPREGHALCQGFDGRKLFAWSGFTPAAELMIADPPFQVEKLNGQPKVKHLKWKRVPILNRSEQILHLFLQHGKETLEKVNMEVELTLNRTANENDKNVLNYPPRMHYGHSMVTLVEENFGSYGAHQKTISSTGSCDAENLTQTQTASTPTAGAGQQHNFGVKIPHEINAFHVNAFYGINGLQQEKGIFLHRKCEILVYGGFLSGGYCNASMDVFLLTVGEFLVPKEGGGTNSAKTKSSPKGAPAGGAAAQGAATSSSGAAASSNKLFSQQEQQHQAYSKQYRVRWEQKALAQNNNTPVGRSYHSCTVLPISVSNQLRPRLFRNVLEGTSNTGTANSGTSAAGTRSSGGGMAPQSPSIAARILNPPSSNGAIGAAATSSATGSSAGAAASGGPGPIVASKRPLVVFFGGITDGGNSSELCFLCTETWKWAPINTAVLTQLFYSTQNLLSGMTRFSGMMNNDEPGANNPTGARFQFGFTGRAPTQRNFNEIVMDLEDSEIEILPDQADDDDISFSSDGMLDTSSSESSSSSSSSESSSDEDGDDNSISEVSSEDRDDKMNNNANDNELRGPQQDESHILHGQLVNADDSLMTQLTDSVTFREEYRKQGISNSRNYISKGKNNKSGATSATGTSGEQNATKILAVSQKRFKHKKKLKGSEHSNLRHTRQFLLDNGRGIVDNNFSETSSISSAGEEEEENEIGKQIREWKLPKQILPMAELESPLGVRNSKMKLENDILQSRTTSREFIDAPLLLRQSQREAHERGITSSNAAARAASRSGTAAGRTTGGPLLHQAPSSSSQNSALVLGPAPRNRTASRVRVITDNVSAAGATSSAARAGGPGARGTANNVQTAQGQNSAQQVRPTRVLPPPRRVVQQHGRRNRHRDRANGTTGTTGTTTTGVRHNVRSHLFPHTGAAAAASGLTITSGTGTTTSNRPRQVTISNETRALIQGSVVHVGAARNSSEIIAGGAAGAGAPGVGPGTSSQHAVIPSQEQLQRWSLWPPARFGHTMFFDTKRCSLFLFGGGTGRDLLRSGDDPFGRVVWEFHLRPLCLLNLNTNARNLTPAYFWTRHSYPRPTPPVTAVSATGVVHGQQQSSLPPGHVNLQEGQAGTSSSRVGGGASTQIPPPVNPETQEIMNRRQGPFSQLIGAMSHVMMRMPSRESRGGGGGSSSTANRNNSTTPGTVLSRLSLRRETDSNDLVAASANSGRSGNGGQQQEAPASTGSSSSPPQQFAQADGTAVGPPVAPPTSSSSSSSAAVHVQVTRQPPAGSPPPPPPAVVAGDAPSVGETAADQGTGVLNTVNIGRTPRAEGRDLLEEDNDVSMTPRREDEADSGISPQGHDPAVQVEQQIIDDTAVSVVDIEADVPNHSPPQTPPEDSARPVVMIGPVNNLDRRPSFTYEIVRDDEPQPAVNSSYPFQEDDEDDFEYPDIEYPENMTITPRRNELSARIEPNANGAASSSSASSSSNAGPRPASRDSSARIRALFETQGDSQEESDNMIGFSSSDSDEDAEDRSDGPRGGGQLLVGGTTLNNGRSARQVGGSGRAATGTTAVVSSTRPFLGPFLANRRDDREPTEQELDEWEAELDERERRVEAHERALMELEQALSSAGPQENQERRRTIGTSTAARQETITSQPVVVQSGAAAARSGERGQVSALQQSATSVTSVVPLSALLDDARNTMLASRSTAGAARSAGQQQQATSSSSALPAVADTSNGGMVNSGATASRGGTLGAAGISTSPTNPAPPLQQNQPDQILLGRCHMACQIGPTIVFFGGGRRAANELLCFNLDSLTWKKPLLVDNSTAFSSTSGTSNKNNSKENDVIKPEKTLECVMSGAAVAVRDTMYVVGGWVGNQGSTTDAFALRFQEL